MSFSVPILLIEDDPSDAEAIDRTLAEVGQYSVTFASTLSEGIEIATTAAREGRPFDVILLDLTLPDAFGPEAVSRLREAAPVTPIVVLTETLDESVGKRSLRLGADDFLIKDELDERLLDRSIGYAIERNVRATQAAENESNLRNIITAIEDAVLIVDQRKYVHFVNTAASRLLKREPSDLRGELLPFSLELDGSSEIVLPAGDDESITGEVRATEVQWEGQPAYLVSIRDVSDRKKAADLRQKLIHTDRLAAIGQLASSVAHEVNTPAGYVLGNLSVLQGQWRTFISNYKEVYRILADCESPEVKDNEDLWDGLLALEGMLTESREMVGESLVGMERIRSILRDLKHFAQIDRDEVELVHLEEVAEAACNLVNNEIRYRAVLEKHLDRVPPVAAHRGKLTQVVTNLLINATQALGEASPAESLIQLSTFETSNRVCLTVKDSGSGIPPELKDRIFEPFFTTKSQDEGTGLGLSLCADIVARHGGLILLDSEEGEGSAFTISLPLCTGLTLHTEDQPLRRELSNANARILVVDDDVLFTRSLKRMLAGAHHVDVAHSGIQAIERLEKDDDYDVVLCDLMMPEMDGVELFDAVVERWPDLVLRLVFLTGGAVTPRAKDFVASIRNVLLDKPIDPDTLLTAIDDVLRINAQQ